MGNKKLNLVLEAIAKAKELTPKGQEVTVNISRGNWLAAIPPKELKNMLLKLQDDEKILELKSFPKWLLDDTTSDFAKAIRAELEPYKTCFVVDVFEGFDEWCAENRTEEQIPFGNLASIQREPTTESEVIYRITYTKSREIIFQGPLLDNVIEVAKPDFDSENEGVFDFLYQRPFKKFTKEQIEAGIHRSIIKPFHKIVENLGFKGDLKRVFFDVSKTSILFRNPITREQLLSLSISKISKLH